MKEIIIRLLMAAAMTFVACALASSARAQQGDEDPSPNSPPHQQPQSPNNTAPSQHDGAAKQPSSEPQTQDSLAFTGVVSRNKDEIVLNDPVTKMVYRFDDPAKAQSYLGKQVKVIGKLGMNSNTILVGSIEVIPEKEHD